MHVRHLSRSALFVAALGGQPLSAQSSWCEFQPGTLGTIIAEHRSDVVDTLRPEQRNWVLTAAPRATRANVTYLGDSRPLTGADSAFLDGYLYRLHRIAPDSAFRGLFHWELRFAEGSDTLWLPVQDSLIPALRTEARPGDRVTVFVRWLGLHQEGAHPTWMFVVNEFATPASEPAWNRVFSQC